MKHARYIIVLDRLDDDDNCGPDGHAPTTDLEGMTQVAAELQDAIDNHGVPAGFFRVVARAEVEYTEPVHVMPDHDAHRAAVAVLDVTRNY
jgi:hypothetical protein